MLDFMATYCTIIGMSLCFLEEIKSGNEVMPSECKRIFKTNFFACSLVYSVTYFSSERWYSWLRSTHRGLVVALSSHERLLAGGKFEDLLTHQTPVGYFELRIFPFFFQNLCVGDWRDWVPVQGTGSRHSTHNEVESLVFTPSPFNLFLLCFFLSHLKFSHKKL